MYFQSVLFQVRIILASRQKSQLEKKAIWEESKSTSGNFYLTFMKQLLEKSPNGSSLN